MPKLGLRRRVLVHDHGKPSTVSLPTVFFDSPLLIESGFSVHGWPVPVSELAFACLDAFLACC